MWTQAEGQQINIVKKFQFFKIHCSRKSVWYMQKVSRILKFQYINKCKQEKNAKPRQSFDTFFFGYMEENK